MPWPWLVLDLETSGELPEYALQPWRLRQKKAWITTAAYSLRKPSGEIITDGTIYPNKKWLRAVLERARDRRMTVIVWNGMFDIAWLVAAGLGDIVNEIEWLDAMLAWKHVDLTPSFATGHSYSLKGPGGAVETFCPEMAGYQEGVDYHDRTPEGLARLLAYDKDDTKATLIAAEKIWTLLDTRQREVALIESATLPMIARSNVDGFHVDHAAVTALSAKLDETAAKMEELLKEHGITETVSRSPKQLSAVLFDKWKLRQVNGRSTAKDYLTELVIEDDRVALLMQYREALNLKGKFIGGIVKSREYNGDGLPRPQAQPFGTYTGRMTYGSKQTVTEPGARPGTTREADRYVGFALHQMKRGKDFRSLIVAPPDHDIVEFDAAGQEFRFMAVVSQDETMLGLCEDGEDPHSFMAAQIYNLDYRTLQAAAAADYPEAKKQRQGGKFANFSLQYRTSPKTVRIRARTEHNLILSEVEAKHIHTTYLRTYLKVPKYWQHQIELGRREKYAENLAGRRVVVKGKWIGPHQWAMESTMINYPVQSTGGDQKYLALKVIKNELAKYDARFAMDMHDGIYFYVPKDKSLKFATEIRKVLDHLPYEEAWNFSPPIPLPWDAKIGPSWGALKPVEG